MRWGMQRAIVLERLRRGTLWYVAAQMQKERKCCRDEKDDSLTKSSPSA